MFSFVSSSNRVLWVIKCLLILWIAKLLSWNGACTIKIYILPLKIVDYCKICCRRPPDKACDNSLACDRHCMEYHFLKDSCLVCRTIVSRVLHGLSVIQKIIIICWLGSYMLRKGMQYFPFRKAVHFFRKVKGKQDWSGKGGKERERKGMMGQNFLSFPSLISPF